MLPTTLVTILSFLLELSSASPVYNMQPAYITATIGSTGRNIRNLPCISRKNSQNGVCMFAIDCLKANGTHLGTCIDRFYFGSCCRVEPVLDIIENTIDTALIPARQPPNRTSSTTEKASNETTQAAPLKEKLTTTMLELTTKLTTIAKVTETATTLPPQTTQFITRKPFTTTQKVTTNKPITTTKISLGDETTIPYRLSTFQSVDGNDVTTIRPFPTTKPPRPIPTKPYKVPTVAQKPKPVTTQKPRPVTAQKLNVTVTTHRPKPVTTQKLKPTPTKVKPVLNATVAGRPRPRPSRPTAKPIKTVKPSQKPLTTVKPVRNVTQKLPDVTRKPVTTTISTTTTERITTTTTAAPVTTTRKVETTTVVKATTLEEIDVTTTRPIPTITEMNALLTTTEKETVAVVLEETTAKASSTESNDLPINVNATSILEAVNGNPATNEIESVKPEKLPSPPAIDTTTPPGLVTWTEASEESPSPSASEKPLVSSEKPDAETEKPVAESEKPVVVPSTASSTTKEPEDWVPITTPDGWVLLPSLSTVTEPTIDSTTASSTTNKSSTESVATSTDSSETVSTSSSIETVISSSSSEVNPVRNETDALGMSTIGSVAESTTVPTSHDAPVNMSDFTHVCGRRMFPEARIVGGEKSSFGKWPWQISLRQWRTSTYLHKCGAALLNENWAITAAHCVDNVPPSDLLLRLGEHDLSTESEPYLHQERRVQIVASHPQFDPRTFEYDLALLRFYEPVQFQPNILPVCVPQNDENFVGRTAYVTGWGRLYEDGPLPSILQEVSVPVINNTVCESMYRSAGYIEHIPNIFICAGWRRGGFDSCEGDSGGPMVIQRPDKRFLLAGVISWGIGCAEPNQPGVYTRISEFRDWINQILQF